MGARISCDTDREMSNLNITCLKGDLSRAVSMLSDAIANPTLDAAEFEIAKQEQAQENENMGKDFQGTTLEACHYNAFRDHAMGQPIRGDNDHLQNLNIDMLNQHKAANFTGENMVIVGTGAVDHDSFVN